MAIHVADIGAELTPENRAIYDEVRGKMDRWIEQQVRGLREGMAAELDRAEAQLRGELEVVTSGLDAARQEMQQIMGSIASLSEGFSEGDGELLEDAIAKTRELVARVNAEIEAHEKRWRGLGEQAVAVAFKAAKSAIGVPL